MVQLKWKRSKISLKSCPVSVICLFLSIIDFYGDKVISGKCEAFSDWDYGQFKI